MVAWLYIAYGMPMHVPDERLVDLFGPNVRDLELMCQAAGFSTQQLYERVRASLPSMEPVEFEIWSCKVVNIIHVLNLRKQPSLCFRRHLHSLGDGPEDEREEAEAAHTQQAASVIPAEGQKISRASGAAAPCKLPTKKRKA